MSSFGIEPGEAVGLVGRNGSGKTTLLRLIAGIFQPTGGTLEVGGSVGSLLSLGAGFHPELSGRENLHLAGSIYGLGRRYINERFDEIVSFAELEESIDLPVRTYSSGMFMRLGFALATHLAADVLLLDEVFAVGDESFQRKCFGKIFEFKARGGTLLFVSHSASAVESLCDRALLLRDGRIDFDGSAHDALQRYQAALAEERDPEERSAGLREWGTGEAQISWTRLEDADGCERQQFLSGEPVSFRFGVTANENVRSPRLIVELRDRLNGLLGASARDPEELGWDGSTGEHAFRFALDRLPLTDGRYMICVAIADATGRHTYHRIDDAASFLVYPDQDDARGSIRLDGSWSAVAARAAEVSR